MKRTLVSATILMFSMVAADSNARTPLLINDKIDAARVIEGFPLTGRQVLKSGDGRKKQLWSIKGMETSAIEIIGNDQSDADQVAMHCVTFDKNGNAVSPVPTSAPCHVLFVRLLGKFTATPDSFAKKLIEESMRSKQTEARRLDDISLETDGEFYAIRRLRH